MDILCNHVDLLFLRLRLAPKMWSRKRLWIESIRATGSLLNLKLEQLGQVESGKPSEDQHNVFNSAISAC